jgi:hypothetical protein
MKVLHGCDHHTGKYRRANSIFRFRFLPISSYDILHPNSGRRIAQFRWERNRFRELLIFFLICIVGGGVQTGSTRHVGHLLAYCTCTGWLWGWRIWWNEWQEKLKYSEKTCPDATLSTINPTWPDPGLNPGRRGGKPATNRFSYGAAFRDSYSKMKPFHWQYACVWRSYSGS